jgi:hypothetical protein
MNREDKMRSLVVALLSVICLAAAFQPAAATPQGRAIAAAGSNVVPIAHKCPQGQHWVPAGYAQHAKYRAGHCAAN